MARVGDKKMLSTAINHNDVGILSALNYTNITTDPNVRNDYKSMLWRSICSEYDSKHFFKMTRSLKINFTQNFEKFLIKWVKDEAMHTAGFKKIYSYTYNVTEDHIDKQLQKRQPDFSGITEFLTDELSICLLLAYDEIVTAHVYERSIFSYQQIEQTILPKWIKKVKQDEVAHFLGIIDVINSEKKHGHDKKIIENILLRILDVDMNQKEYGGTFVLDHACPEFPLTKQDILNICIKTILKKIR